MGKAMLKASIVASAVFALAWIRVPPAWIMLLRTLVGYGVLITIFAMLLGLPLALLIERLRIGRWWSYLAVAMVLGALLGSILSSHPMGGIENPFALTFSPWTRAHPGLTDNPPIRWIDWQGTIAFGAVVGGALGISFWFFYSRRRAT